MRGEAGLRGPRQHRLTFTLCTLIRFPQLSRYCLRSLSCNGKHTSACPSLGPHPPPAERQPSPRSCRKPPRTHQVLKDEGEGTLRVDDVVQGDDVGVFQVLQQRHCKERRRQVGAAGPGTVLCVTAGDVHLHHPSQTRLRPSIAHEGCDGEKPLLPSPSRMAVQGAPSSCSRRISFRATRFSVSLLRPLKTVA